jgi:hypothetical protein
MPLSPEDRLRADALLDKLEAEGCLEEEHLDWLAAHCQSSELKGRYFGILGRLTLKLVKKKTILPIWDVVARGLSRVGITITSEPWKPVVITDEVDLRAGCSRCGGSGHWVNRTPRGRINHLTSGACFACHGVGSINASWLSRAEVEAKKTSALVSSALIRCERCSGTGHRYDTCSACDRGHSPDGHICKQCDGYGRRNISDCGKCNGLGVLRGAGRWPSQR